MNQFVDPDWFWIQKIKEGDTSAFEEIFKRHKVNVINLAFRFTRSREVAEDIAQDVFIKIYEGRVHYDPNSKFTTWLYRVTVNASIDFLRRKKFFPVSLSAQGSSENAMIDTVRDERVQNAGDAICEKETQDFVRREIDRLPEKFKSVILLYQFQEMSYREIAQILVITEKAVERRLYQAKELLRKKLGGLS